jgi:hypothetical protein
VGAAGMALLEAAVRLMEHSPAAAGLTDAYRQLLERVRTEVTALLKGHLAGGKS